MEKRNELIKDDHFHLFFTLLLLRQTICTLIVFITKLFMLNFNKHFKDKRVFIACTFVKNTIRHSLKKILLTKSRSTP